eukprot:Transcript_7428.p1 GENE.Transcript_7428~~Transcript_7428.p1  ORF type:complete len:313 (-),score=98.81 Transcript_7428:185-1123(-)
MEQPSSPPPQQPRARLQGPKSSHHAGNAKHGMALGLSGGVAGAVAKTAVAPLERIKLLNQAGQSAGLFATLHKVMHNEGWRALWRGNTVNVIRMIPNKGILLGCSDVYKDAMRSLCLGPFWTGALSGALAGGTAIVLTYPLDLARTRMAGFLLQKGEVTQYPTLVATISAVYRTEGFRALFRGVGPTLAGSFPYEGIKFGTYGWLKRNDGGGGSAVWRASCGAAAATLAHVITYPNDTVRRRLQIQGAPGSEMRYSGALDCFHKMVQQEGWRSLYAGIRVTILRGVPNTGIQFCVYEACKDLLIERERRWNL